MVRAAGYSLLLSLFLCMATAQPVVGSVRHTLGVARDTGDDSVRYIEHHQYLEDGRHIVRYYDTGHTMLLEKEMRYPGLPQHPTLRQSDYRTNTEITIDREDGIATMKRKQLPGEHPASEEQFTFRLTEDTVVDAGFDAFIRGNWQRFGDGREYPLRFAAAGQDRLIKMQISHTGRENRMDRFTIEPANWFVRLMIPAINLYYDENRRLVRYEGFSNLKPGEGASREVVIRFEHYDLDRSLSQPLPEWLPFSAAE